MAIYSLTGYEPNQLDNLPDNFDYSETFTSIFQSDSVDIDTAVSYTIDAELHPHVAHSSRITLCTLSFSSRCTVTALTSVITLSHPKRIIRWVFLSQAHLSMEKSRRAVESLCSRTIQAHLLFGRFTDASPRARWDVRR